jgi:hypothetical protein
MKTPNNCLNGHVTALSTSTAYIGVLSNMQEKLQASADELQRMEDEGGLPLSKAQCVKIDTYFKLSQSIRKSILIVRKRRSARIIAFFVRIRLFNITRPFGNKVRMYNVARLTYSLRK